MKVLILFILPFFVFGQQQSENRLKNYVGYYLPSLEPSSAFSQSFMQIDLNIENDVLAGQVHFFTDTSYNSIDESVVCDIESIEIYKDSLYFRTKKCRNELYEFRGRFIVPYQEFGLKDENVLDGIIYLYINDKLIRHNKIAFLYSEGC